MRAVQVAAAAVGLSGLPQQVMASMVEQVHYLSKRNSVPNMQYQFDTIKTCTWWYDNNEGLTCQDVRDFRYAIKPEVFSRWNPSITLDCGNWLELSYCVDVEAEREPPSITSTPTTISATPTATARSTRKPMLKGWKPLGCYIDDHTLSNHTTKEGGSSLTVSKCEAACFSDDLQYAGVKAGDECWCGTYVARSWTPNQADCNVPCAGDSLQTCGGSSAFNIFEAQTKDTLLPLLTPEGTTTTKPTAFIITAKTTSATTKSSAATAMPT